MADYTIDKIHYGSDTYLLEDSDAIHEVNGEVNINKLNTNYIKNTETIYSNTIDTQYLTVHESANIHSATIDDLIATKARVVATLDVDGEMHTKSWTNSNIAHIGGNFYISPDMTCDVDGMKLQINNIENASAQGYTLTVRNGTFTSQLALGEGETTVTAQDWTVGSKVMMTGVIINENQEFPLGTCSGILSTPITATQKVSGFTIQRVYSNVIDNLIQLDKAISSNYVQTNDLVPISGKTYYIYQNNQYTQVSITEFDRQQTYYEYISDLFFDALEIKITLYSLGPNAILDSNIVAGYKPVGIMMTAYGIDSQSYIDIYGGTIPTNNRNRVEPVVRVGLLNDLPSLRLTYEETSDSIYDTSKIYYVLSNNEYVQFEGETFESGVTYYERIEDLSTKPKGWGIYTSNGYFKGRIIANAGLIGGFTIDSDKLTYQNVTNVKNTSVQGAYLGTDGFNISGGSENKTTFFTNNEVIIGGVLHWQAPEDNGLGTLKILADEITIGTIDDDNNPNTDEIDCNVKEQLRLILGKNIIQDDSIQKNSNDIDIINTILSEYVPFIKGEPNVTIPYIDLQYKSDLQYNPKLKITSQDINFSLGTDDNIIFKISNNLTHTTFGEYENLRMRVGEVGNLTWVARSNGHLSLKVVE